MSGKNGFFEQKTGKGGRSGQQGLDEMSVHIGQAALDPIVAEGQAFVVEPE